MTTDASVHPDVASNIDLLSAWIESQMAYSGQPGLSIGIVHDQELVWARAFGFANVEKQIAASPTTRYRIASITKLFTSTAILILRDEGKVQLDDPIARHLPWFDIRQRYPDAPPITIRHLLTHTSGLPREAAFPYWTDSNFPTRDQLRTALPHQETTHPTETRWKYSNLALSLAGEIVAAVSGADYEDFVQQRILNPLGMTDSHVRSPDPDDPKLAVGYGRRMPGGARSTSPFTDSGSITPAANMATTVEDLARFAMLQFRDRQTGGDQILRGSTLQEMQRVHWIDPSWKLGWGLGFNIIRERDVTYVGHGGSVQGYRTRLLLCPADKTAVIVLTNADDCDPLLYADRAFRWVAPAIVKRAVPEPKPATPDPGWHRYIGRYRDAWSDRQVMIHNGKLVIIDPTLLHPMESLATLTPVAEHTFRHETKDGYRSPGALAVFEVDGDGKVQRLELDENYSYPVETWG